MLIILISYNCNSVIICGSHFCELKKKLCILCCKHRTLDILSKVFEKFNTLVLEENKK